MRLARHYIALPRYLATNFIDMTIWTYSLSPGCRATASKLYSAECKTLSRQKLLFKKKLTGQRVAVTGMKEPPQLSTIGHKNLSASTFTINMEKGYSILMFKKSPPHVFGWIQRCWVNMMMAASHISCMKVTGIFSGL
jgi:hypothetical protein